MNTKIRLRECAVEPRIAPRPRRRYHAYYGFRQFECYALRFENAWLFAYALRISSAQARRYHQICANIASRLLVARHFPRRSPRQSPPRPTDRKTIAMNMSALSTAEPAVEGRSIIARALASGATQRKASAAANFTIDGRRLPPAYQPHAATSPAPVLRPDFVSTPGQITDVTAGA